MGRHLGTQNVDITLLTINDIAKFLVGTFEIGDFQFESFDRRITHGFSSYGLVAQFIPNTAGARASREVTLSPGLSTTAAVSEQL